MSDTKLHTEKGSREEIARMATEAELRTPFSAWLVVGACAFYYVACLGLVTGTSFWRANISADIGGSAISLWLADSYLLIVVVVGPAFGRIGDSCGRFWLTIIGSTFGFLGCAVLASAKSMNVAILGASFFGLSFAILCNMYAIAVECVSRHHRGTANSIMELSSCIGVWLAQYAGAGFIVNTPGGLAGWRSLFWFFSAMYIISGITFFVLYRPLPPPNPLRLSIAQRLIRIDLVGTILFALSLTPFLLGLIWGGGSYPWKSAAVLVPLCVGIVMLFVFAAHQIWIEKNGIFAHSMFQNRNYAISLYGCLVEGMVYLVFNAFYGEETSSIFESRPYLLATRFAAFQFAIVLFVPLYAIYVYKTRQVKGVLLFGYVLMLAATGGMMGVKPNTNILPIAMCALAGAGFGSPQTFLTTVVQLSVPPETVGLASALTQSARFVGGSVGIAASGAIFTGKIGRKLPAYIAQAAIQAGLPANSVTAFVAAIASGAANEAAAVEGATPQILQAGAAAAKSAYADSFLYIWVFVLPFVVLGLVGVLFLHPVQAEMNGHVDRPTEKVAADLQAEQQEAAARSHSA